MLRYRTTAKGRDHFSVLGDPTHLSPESRSRAERMREQMVSRDWALQKICVLFDHPEGVDVVRLTHETQIRMRGRSRDLSADKLILTHAPDLIDDLLKRGFLELLAE